MHPFNKPVCVGITRELALCRCNAKIQFDGVWYCGTHVKIAQKKGDELDKFLPLCDVNCECSVCYDQVSASDATKLGCGHVFCKGCIKDWMKACKNSPTCPMCRAVMPIELDVLMAKKMKELQILLNLSTKVNIMTVEKEVQVRKITQLTRNIIESFALMQASDYTTFDKYKAFCKKVDPWIMAITTMFSQ